MDETAKVELSVRDSADSLSVLVDCVVTEANVGELVDMLSSELTALKIASPPGRDGLVLWVVGQVSGHGPVLKDAVVVKGVAPVPPTFVAGEDFRLSAMLEDKEDAVAQLNGELAQLEGRTRTILSRVATLFPETQAKLGGRL